MRVYEFWLGTFLALCGAHVVFHVGVGHSQALTRMMASPFFMPANVWMMLAGSGWAASAYTRWSFGRFWFAAFSVTGFAACAFIITVFAQSLSYGALLATGAMLGAMHTAFGKPADA